MGMLGIQVLEIIGLKSKEINMKVKILHSEYPGIKAGEIKEAQKHSDSENYMVIIPGHLNGLCFHPDEVEIINEVTNVGGIKIESGEKQFGHPDFYKLLEQMADLHSCKNHDYAGTSDPLKNLRACKRLNLEPFLGVVVRLQDKWSRLEEFVKSGQLMVKNESVLDTLMDNAVYSLLAIILYKEQQEKGGD